MIPDVIRVWGVVVLLEVSESIFYLEVALDC